MNISTAISPILAAVIILLGGCEILNHSKDIERGTVEVQVEGYIKRSFEGEAVFKTHRGLKDEPVFELMLKDVIEPENRFRVVHFILSNHDRPGVGAYKLADFENIDKISPGTIKASYQESDSYGRFRSKGGTLRISLSNEHFLKGSFEFPEYEFIPVDTSEYRKEVNITGEFYAEEGNTGTILN